MDQGNFDFPSSYLSHVDIPLIRAMRVKTDFNYNNLLTNLETKKENNNDVLKYTSIGLAVGVICIVFWVFFCLLKCSCCNRREKLYSTHDIYQPSKQNRKLKGGFKAGKQQPKKLNNRF